MFPAFRAGHVAGLAPRLLSRLTIAPRVVLRAFPARALSVSAPLAFPAKTTTKRAAVRKAPAKKKAAPKKKTVTSRGRVAAAKAKAKKKPATRKAAVGRGRTVVKRKVVKRKVVKKKPAAAAVKPALPTVPKRGPLPFTVFVASKKPFPKGILATEFIRDIAAEWRGFSDDQKKPFVEQAATQRAQRETAFKNFVDKLDPTTLRRLNTARKAKGRPRILIPQEKRRPISSYLRFYKEQHNSGALTPPEGLTNREAFKAKSAAASAKWRQMNDADKAPYFESFARDWATYKRANSAP